MIATGRREETEEREFANLTSLIAHESALHG
jgi:hypothetical protein